MKPHHYQQLFLADTHLGHPYSRNTHLLSQFLSTTRTQHLILAGDIIEAQYLAHFPQICHPEQTAILPQLTTIAETITYLPGNHDNFASLLKTNQTTFNPEVFLRTFNPTIRQQLTQPLQALARATIKPHLQQNTHLTLHGHTNAGLFFEFSHALGEKLSAWHLRPPLDLKPESIATANAAFDKLGYSNNLACFATRNNAHVIIHGHTHGRSNLRHVSNITLLCLPNWMQQPGGALVQYPDNSWAIINHQHQVVQTLPELAYNTL